MISTASFRKIALSLPEVSELPHFEKTSFRVQKKIFASVDEKNYIATIKLSPVDQSVFCAIDPGMIHIVSGSWGKQGWTNIHLKKVTRSILIHLLTSAYSRVGPCPAFKKIVKLESPC